MTSATVRALGLVAIGVPVPKFVSASVGDIWSWSAGLPRDANFVYSAAPALVSGGYRRSLMTPEPFMGASTPHYDTAPVFRCSVDEET